MQNHLADGLLELERGFEFQKERWHCAVIGVKGDFPFLAKSGRFERHWLRAQRSADSKKEPEGVCWLCQAGKGGLYPWEDFNMCAGWARAGNLDPWAERPGLLRLLHVEAAPAEFWRPDIWHCYHGGAGKIFIASVLAEIVIHLFDGNRVVRCDLLGEELRKWSKLGENEMPHSGVFLC